MPKRLYASVARRLSPPVLAGLAAVAVARLATLPRSLWEYDEMLFAEGVQRFDPLHHRPHPPGYPLLIGLGKALDAVCHDSFVSLVTLSVISSLIGYLALTVAFRALAAGAEGSPDTASGGAAETVAVVGALLFSLSPGMLVVGPLAMSDPPALMFLALALAAAALLPRSPGLRAAFALGATASAAIGCRPQLAIVVVPFLATVVLLDGQRRRAAALLAAFTAVSLLWFVPLVVATGGPAGLLGFLGKQAKLVAEFDAGQARDRWSAAALVNRFVAHPWGPRWTSLPVLVLALAGALLLLWRRRRELLPLAVLTGFHLAFCVAVLEPEDGVRYSLPGQIGVAFAAATALTALTVRAAPASRRRRPALAYLPLALLVAGFAAYTGPLLRTRATTLSPPAQAARWMTANLSKRAVLLVDEPLMAHAAHLLPGFVKSRPQDGLDRYASRRFQPLYYWADGESEWPGAQSFRWPASDAYGKLTRNHYRVVSVSPIPSEARFEAVSGVSPYEPGFAQPHYRWLGPRAVLRVYPRGARAVSLVLGLTPQAPWPANAVTVAVDGRPAAEIIVPRDGRIATEIALPAGAAVEISLAAASSFVPAALGINPDRRALAVQLYDFRLIDL
jgi:hypothetical protein